MSGLLIAALVAGLVVVVVLVSRRIGRVHRDDDATFRAELAPRVLIDRYGDRWELNPEDHTYSMASADGVFQRWPIEAVIRLYGPVRTPEEQS